MQFSVLACPIRKESLAVPPLPGKVRLLLPYPLGTDRIRELYSSEDGGRITYAMEKNT